MDKGRLFEQEIQEQPEVLTRFLDRQAKNVVKIADLIRRRDIEHIVIAARGTSDNAAIYGRYALESHYGAVVSLAAPSLFTLYHRPPRLGKALVIGVSQSGQGADVVEVVAQAKQQGALTLGVTNFAESPLAKAADCVILLEAGEERAVAATKTYTAQLMALALLTAALSGDDEYMETLRRVPDVVAEAVALKGMIKQSAERYRYMQSGVTLGRGYNYATAFEAALKLKETCYLAIEPYSTADYRHGPIAVAAEGFPALLIGPSGAVFDDVLACAQELRDKNAELIVFSDREELLSLARLPVRMPAPLPEWLTPIPYIVPCQLFALYLSLARGHDPDQPRGLKKVTVTR